MLGELDCETSRRAFGDAIFASFSFIYEMVRADMISSTLLECVCANILTLFRGIRHELSDESDHPVRNSYALLDGQYPLEAFHKLGVESLLPDQHGSFRTRLCDLCALLLNLSQRDHILAVVRHVVLDLSKDGWDESEIVDEVIRERDGFTSRPRDRSFGDRHLSTNDSML